MAAMDAQQPPEGVLLEQAREHTGISQNEAARQAGISGTRWRQIVHGFASTMTSPRGVKTLARMARVVGVTPDQMEAVGRGDVANQIRFEQGGSEPTVAELAAELEAMKRSSAGLEQAHADLKRRLEEIMGDRHPREP